MGEETGETPPEILQAKFEDLIVDEGARQEYITAVGKKVLLRKLNTKDVREITRLAKEDSVAYAMFMVARGTVDPAMSPAQVEKMAPPLMFEIANAVARFSALDTESLRKARFLPSTTLQEGDTGP